MDISIIVPSFNSGETIGLALEAMLGQKTSARYEIIVVDCSDDDRVERICRERAGVTCLRETERFTPGRGRNIGCEHASGGALLFVDADVLLDEDAVENAWKRFREGFAVFGGALKLGTLGGRKFPALVEHAFFNHENHGSMGVRRRRNLSSALLGVERSLFLEDGGFRDIPRMQDTELTERLARQGNDLYFFPDVAGRQIQDSSFGQVFRKIHVCGLNTYGIRYRRKESPLFRALAFLLLPAAAFAKMSRINLRNIRFDREATLPEKLLLVPVMYLCGLVWMYGAYGAVAGKGISRTR